METFSRETLTPWWVTGFADSNATFTFSRSGRQIAMYFAVKLTASDESVLVRLRDYLGVGKIYGVTGRFPGAVTKTSRLYRVTRIADLRAVVAHFESYPLQTEKRTSYTIWKEMVALKAHFRTPDREAMEQFALRLTQTSMRNHRSR